MSIPGNWRPSKHEMQKVSRKGAKTQRFFLSGFAALRELKRIRKAFE